MLWHIMGLGFGASVCAVIFSSPYEDGCEGIGAYNLQCKSYAGSYPRTQIFV